MGPRPILPVKVPVTIDTMSTLYRAEYRAKFQINRTQALFTRTDTEIRQVKF